MSFASGVSKYFHKINNDVYLQKDTNEFCSRFSAILAIVALANLSLFGILNLTINPNFSIFSDVVTSSQISFIVGCTCVATICGIISMISHANYRNYDRMIKCHRFKNIKTVKSK